MDRFVSPSRLGAALLALCVPAALHAQAVAPARNAASSTTIYKPLSLTKKQDLDFGTIVVAGAGTVVVNPVTHARSTTGGVSGIGAGAHAAVFTAVTGSKNSVVIIRIPRDPIVLTRNGGPETMTVGAWTLDGDKTRKAANGVAFDFAVGATLNVGAAQTDGLYEGTFEVGVQYP